MPVRLDYTQGKKEGGKEEKASGRPPLFLRPSSFPTEEGAPSFIAGEKKRGRGRGGKNPPLGSHPLASHIHPSCGFRPEKGGLLRELFLDLLSTIHTSPPSEGGTIISVIAPGGEKKKRGSFSFPSSFA